jgi:hypothetical protein
MNPTLEPVQPTEPGGEAGDGGAKLRLVAGRLRKRDRAARPPREQSSENPLPAGDDLVVGRRLGVTEPEQAGAAAEQAELDGAGCRPCAYEAAAGAAHLAPVTVAQTPGAALGALDDGARSRDPLVRVNRAVGIPTLDGTPALKLGLHASTLDNLSTTATRGRARKRK